MNVGAWIVKPQHINALRVALFQSGWLKAGTNVTPYFDEQQLSKKGGGAQVGIHASHLAASTMRELTMQNKSLSEAAHLIPPKIYDLLCDDQINAQWIPGLRVLSPQCVKTRTSTVMTGMLKTSDEVCAQSRDRIDSQPPFFTFVELFAGIGGFRVGLEKLGGSCTFASEIDRDARELYSINFESNKFDSNSGKQVLYGDISEVESDTIGEHDILTGGFPCQSFSLSGDRQGFEDKRGLLFLEIVRVLRDCQPKAFILENVSNLVFMDKGATMNTILSEFEKCGYSVSWRVINLRVFLPQQRSRVYIVGFRKDTTTSSSGSSSQYSLTNRTIKRFEWPELPNLSTTIRDILEPGSTCGETVLGLGKVQVGVTDRCSLHYGGVDNDEMYLLSPHQFDKISQTTDYQKDPRLRLAQLDSAARTLMSSYRRGYYCRSEFVYRPEFGATRPRFYTPRECARLQGFPSSFILESEWTKRSPGRIYHQLGNAVSPPIVAAICSHVLEHLDMLNINKENLSSIASTVPPNLLQFQHGHSKQIETSHSFVSNNQSLKGKEEKEDCAHDHHHHRHRQLIAPALELLLESYPRPDETSKTQTSIRSKIANFLSLALPSESNSFNVKEEVVGGSTGYGKGLYYEEDVQVLKKLLSSHNYDAKLSALSSIGRMLFLELETNINTTPASTEKQNESSSSSFITDQNTSQDYQSTSEAILSSDLFPLLLSCLKAEPLSSSSPPPPIASIRLRLENTMKDDTYDPLLFQSQESEVSRLAVIALELISRKDLRSGGKEEEEEAVVSLEKASPQQSCVNTKPSQPSKGSTCLGQVLSQPCCEAALHTLFMIAAGDEESPALSRTSWQARTLLSNAGLIPTKYEK